MEWLNFRHLYAFWSVCRYGGFQKASEKVFVSQSAISEQVSQLEEYFDEKLLERTTRSLRVTTVGNELLTYADEIFSRSSEINHLFREKNRETPSRPIRIGMVGGISRNFVYSMIIQHMVDEDNPSLQIVDGSFDELSQLLKSFDVDLIFSLEAPRKKELIKFSCKKVFSSPLCIAGKPALVKALKAKRKKTEPVNVFLFNHSVGDHFVDEVVSPRFLVQCRTPLVTDDISLLRFMAHSGRGVAVIPEVGVSEDLDAGTLSRVRLEEVAPVEFFATFLKDGGAQGRIADFLD